MSHDVVRTDSRQGGNVRRYHTWSVHHQQTIAHHTWNVMRILVEIWRWTGMYTQERSILALVLVYTLYHDVCEVATGDVPFPVKRENPDLKATMDRLETETELAMGIDVPLISPEWSARVKICDLLEMWEFGMEEMLMGSVMARPIVARTGEVVAEMTRALSTDDQRRVRDYMQRRVDWYERARA